MIKYTIYIEIINTFQCGQCILPREKDEKFT